MRRTSVTSAALGWASLVAGGVIVRFEATTAVGLVLVGVGALLLLIAKKI